MIRNKPNRSILQYELEQKYKGNNQFGGIYQDSDTPKLHKNKFYIILLKPTNKTSGHWQTILTTNDKSFFFDSFALPPDLAILKRMKEFSDKCYMNTNILQGATSSRCGYFIEYVIDEWLKGKKFPDIINSLSKIGETDDRW